MPLFVSFIADEGDEVLVNLDKVLFVRKCNEDPNAAYLVLDVGNDDSAVLVVGTYRAVVNRIRASVKAASQC